VRQTKVFDAARLFVQTEGIIPAPESAHAILSAMEEALAAKKEGVSRNILFNLTGHGHLDLASYDSFLAGQLQDYDHPEEEIAKSMASLPKVG